VGRATGCIDGSDDGCEVGSPEGRIVGKYVGIDPDVILRMTLLFMSAKYISPVDVIVKPCGEFSDADEAGPLSPANAKGLATPATVVTIPRGLTLRTIFLLSLMYRSPDDDKAMA